MIIPPRAEFVPADDNPGWKPWIRTLSYISTLITPTIDEEGELNIKQNLKGDIMILMLSGKIMGGPDHDKFQSEIKTLISDGHVDILLDMHKVNWVNSTGLGILVSAYHTLKKNGGQLKICQVSDRIDNILNVTQLKLVFETFEKCDDALASFEQG
jgi:anti-sigma B factor antagonist